MSGHACQEELKMILALTKPKYFIPVHGEHRHLMLHAALAEKMGINETFVLENGNVLEIDKKEAKVTGNVSAGKILVDGLVKKKVKKEVKRGFSEPEQKINNTRRDSRGNLRFASGVDDTESILGKGMKLDL